jgi:exopolyphosphatase/guanosine-5'-triphosphate,3'-diphosphate pyrophosphatase
LAAAVSNWCSLPLGSLRLPGLRTAGGANFSRAVHRILRGAEWVGDHDLPLYLVGGSWRALARFAMHRESWPLDDPHGYEITPESALALVRSLRSGTNLGDIPGISKSRLASLPDAAALLGALVREFHPSKLVFSSWGLREGLLNARLNPVTQAQDPLLAGIASFCELYGVAASTASMVAGWTARVNPADGVSGEPLRLAATLLALASMQVEPNLRAEQAVAWALRKRWTGISARGRAVLAMATLANAGRTAVPDSLSRLATQEELREAIAWGLAIRLCRKFSGCAPESISSSALTFEPGLLVLTVRRPFDALASNSVERCLTLLSNWLGREPQLRILAPNERLS